MKRFCALCSLTMLLISSLAAAEVPGWKTQRLHEKSFTEGAAAGDIDHDGHIDVVAGPFWYSGPHFTQRGEIYPPKEFPVAGYSDNFFSYVIDANGDGRNDVLVFGFPGKEARLYVNPGSEGLKNHWPVHVIADQVANESPTLVDLIPGGLPEIVCAAQKQYGYYQATDDALQPWKWNAVSAPGTAAVPFGHGLGVGDLNGDRRLDVIDKQFWWEQPAADSKGWKQHQWAVEPYGRGGAQIHVYDVDGDGDQDVITSHNAHGYGLSWFERVSPDRFMQHPILGVSSTENPYGVAVSQLHAIELADIDGDGRMDIVTGKRWKAHNGKDPGSGEPAAVYWLRNVQHDGQLEFVPHLVDDDSGVGVEVLVADLNADGRPDIVSSNKKCLAVHLQDATAAAKTIPPELWRVPQGRSQEHYANGFPVAEAAKNMEVPEGFSTDLIVGEPDLVQPIAMCFDARGRIWVIEGCTYPQKAPPGQGQDRILIFEDTDANGSFETRKTFVEHVNLASGIEVGFGGIWVGAAPELLFFPDRNRDDVPDGEPTVVLDGWGYQDTHETLNSFTWGPDGWLYGCQGVFTHSKVGKPGAPEEERTPINAGVWRVHPVTHQFEVYAHGTSNPWGVDFNDHGDWFITACVIPHLFHFVQGGRYHRQAGQHYNPYTYEVITTIADHAHYTGNIADHAFWGDNKTARPPAPTETSLMGGGHAHCGLAIYLAGEFPPAFRGDLLFHNLHGHRVVRDRVEADGSGYVGRHRPDFALSHDHNEVGVGVMLGPDGAIYTSDWHDPQTCHNRTPETWDRTDGRIFRVRYGQVKPYRFNLWEASDAELVAMLKHDNAFYARQAQRILHERAADKSLSRDAVLKELKPLLAESSSPVIRLRALWAEWTTGVITPAQLAELLRDADPHMRAWAVQLLGEASTPADRTVANPTDHQLVGVGEDVLGQLVAMSRQDASPVVRRYLASLLQRLPYAQRWALAEGLLTHRTDQHDRNLPLLIWYGVEPLFGDDAVRALHLVRASGWTQLLQLALRRTAVDPQGRDALVKALGENANDATRIVILQELLKTVRSQAGAEMPAAWPNVYRKLIGSQNAELKSLTRSVAIQFGDESVFPHFRAVLADPSQRVAARKEALDLLAAAEDPGLPAVLRKLLDEPALRVDAIRAFSRFNLADTPELLLSKYAACPEAAQLEILGTLVSRKSYAITLTDAMEAGTVDARKVPAYVIRQMVSFDDAALTGRLEAVWGKIGTTSADKQKLLDKYRKMLQPKAIAKGNLSVGRQLYDANCGKCHKLFGEGATVGPDLTGANRTDVNYWLENIIDPNAVIGRNYQMETFVTVRGLVINGLVTEENDAAVTVQTVNDPIVIAKDDIDLRKTTTASLMPEGQLEPMPDLQVQSLFRYLMNPSQVSLPTDRLKNSLVQHVQQGDLIFEGEELVSAAKVTGGNVRPQGMQHFTTSSWSGDSQLWWTSGNPKDRLTIDVPVKGPGQYDALLLLTQAKDYAQIRIESPQLPARDVDLYDPTVRLATPVEWKGIRVADGESLRLQIEITGANPEAMKRFMVGIDALRLRPVNSP